MKKKNILILISNYYPIFGGAEKQAQLQAEKLVQRGHDVTILTALKDDSRSNEVINSVRVKRVQYPKIKLVGAFIFYTKIVIHLLVYGGKYDIYHVHMVKNLAFIASVIGAIQGKNVLLKFTGWWELDLGVLNQIRNKKLKNKLLLWGLKKASYYISISNEITQRAIDAGFTKEKIMYIPNGVDMSLFNREIAPTVSLSLQTVLFVGRLVEEKGLFILLEAWTTVMKEHRDCRLDIVGDGPLRQQLEEMSSKLAIAEKVRFHGKSENTATHYKSADIYVLPSFHEGLSNTLLEAMASRLPVVSTKISGTIDILEDGITGFLVKPGSPTELSESILALLGSKNLREEFGQRGRNVIQDKFSIETVVTQLESLYAMGVNP